MIPFHTQHCMVLPRNLLYTAVTRGKKLVIIVGTKKALAMTVTMLALGGLPYCLGTPHLERDEQHCHESDL